MSRLFLPKAYLSYSAMDLWTKDPETFRRRYYEGEPYLSTPYTEFGSQVGKALEKRDWDNPVIAPVKGKVPQLSFPEKKLEVGVHGVPILAYLDDFDPVHLNILEYKTGIRDKDGNAPWDRVAVRKHKQLSTYALLIREMYGWYNPDIKLVWMETKWTTRDKVNKLGTKEFVEPEKGLKLTGHVEIFDRRIEEWELDRQAELIKEIAGAISEDYTLWRTTKK